MENPRKNGKSTMSAFKYYLRKVGHGWFDVMPFAVSYPSETYDAMKHAANVTTK